MNISGYQLGRQVAAGRFSTVYNALNLDNSRTVTVQVFSPSLTANEEFCDQFKATVNKLSGHRFGILTPVIGAMVGDEECYLITDYFPCPEQGPSELPDLNVKQVLKIGLSIASTLNQLHDVGLIHGGVERNSVVIPSAENPLLSPIDLLRVLPASRLSTMASMSLEQLQYLAPEAEHELTAATDFYALGVLLYQLICKRSPFPAHDAASLLRQKSTPDSIAIKNHHKHLQPLFRGLLAADKSDRIQNLQAFEQALADCLIQLQKTADSIQGTTDTTTADTSVVNTAPIKHKHRSIRLIAAIVEVVSIALPMYFLVHEETKPPPARDRIVLTRQANMPTTPLPETPQTPVDDRNSSAALYQQAQSSIQKDRYGQALLLINTALESEAIPLMKFLPAITSISKSGIKFSSIRTR